MAIYPSCCIFITFFLLLSSIQLYDILRIVYFLPVNGHLIVSSFWILWNKIAMNTYRSSCRKMSSIFLVELLGHMISVCLTLYMKLLKIFKVVVSFYIPISNVWKYSVSVIIMDMFIRDFEVIFPYVFGLDIKLC